MAKPGPKPKGTPEERAARAAAAQRRAARNWHRRNKHQVNDHRREKNFRWRGKDDPRERAAFLELLGMRVDSAKRLDHPAMLWMDKHGVLHKEENLSAEELIARWLKEEKQKCH